MGRKLLLFVGVVAALSGCVSLNETTPVARQSPATAAMKAQIVDGASDVKQDPTSIRRAEISWAIHDPNGAGYLVCVRAQRRGSDGSFRMRTRLTQFGNAGNIMRGSGAWDSPFCANPDIRWQSFPDIHAISG